MADEHPRLRALSGPLGVNLAALGWGFAEATLFFLVPDVLLTYIALYNARAAWVACFWALAGALVGGTLMYFWGAYDAGTALAVLDAVPAISRPMCDAVGEQIRTQGAAALFVGPVSGTPYKIYAVEAGAEQINLLVFLAVSVPARLLRFAAITGLAVLACRLVPKTTLFVRRMIHVVLWGTFYCWYFWRFSELG